MLTDDSAIRDCPRYFPPLFPSVISLRYFPYRSRGKPRTFNSPRPQPKTAPPRPIVTIVTIGSYSNVLGICVKNVTMFEVRNTEGVGPLCASLHPLFRLPIAAQTRLSTCASGRDTNPKM